MKGSHFLCLFCSRYRFGVLLRLRLRLAIPVALALAYSAGAFGDGIDQAAAEGDEDSWLELEESEGLTVTAQPLAPVPVDTLDRAAIAESDASDLGELLERETPVSVGRNGGYGTVATLSLSGFSGSRVGVTVDGVPVNSPLSGGFDPGDIDTAAVDGITIRPNGGGFGAGADSRAGPSGSLPGGIIEIRTAGPVDKGFRYVFSAVNRSYLSSRLPDPVFISPFDAQEARAHADFGTETIGVRLGGFGVRTLNRYGWADENGAERIREDAPVTEGGANAALSVKVSPFSRISASALFHAADRTIVGPVTGDAGKGRQRDARALESLRLETVRLGSDLLSGGLSLGHTGTSIDWSDASGSAKHEAHTASLSLGLNWYPADAVSVSFSVNAQSDAVNSDNAGNRVGFSGGTGAGLSWQPTRSLIVAPSATLVSDGHTTVPVPSVAIAADTGGGYRVGAGAWRAFRFPSFNDRYWTGDPSAEGNPNLKPEDGYGISAWFDRSIADWSLLVSARAVHYRNAILWTAENSVWKPDNVGEAWYSGTTETFTRKLGKTGSAALTHEWLFTRVVTGDLDWADGKYMPYAPVHRLKFTLGETFGRVRLALSGAYSGTRYTGVLNAAALPSWFVADISARMPLAHGFTFSGKLGNVFGESRELVEGYPMPGASLTISISYDGAE